MELRAQLWKSKEELRELLLELANNIDWWISGLSERKDHRVPFGRYLIVKRSNASLYVHRRADGRLYACITIFRFGEVEHDSEGACAGKAGEP